MSDCFQPEMLYLWRKKLNRVEYQNNLTQTFLFSFILTDLICIFTQNNGIYVIDTEAYEMDQRTIKFILRTHKL